MTKQAEDAAPDDDLDSVAVSEADLAAMREFNDDEETSGEKEEQLEKDSTEGDESASEGPDVVKGGKVPAESEAESSESSGEGEDAGAGADEKVVDKTAESDDDDFVDEGKKPLQYEVATLEGVEDRTKALDEKAAELKTQYEDGDITTVEYMDAREAITADRTNIELDRRSAAQTEALNAANARDRWDDDQARFFTENGEFKNSKGLSGALQAHFNEVYIDDAWSKRSGLAQLRESARRVREDLGIEQSAPVVPAKDKGDTPAAKAEALKGRGKQPKLPPDLGSAPAAAEAEMGKDKFAFIDDLEGADFEGAIAALSPDERDRFLGQSH